MRRTAVVACVSAAVAIAAGCGNGGAGNPTGTGGSATGTGSSTTGTGGSGGSPKAGPFTSQGASSYEAQTSVAADTKDNLVAAWIAFFADDTSAIGYAVSRDGGTTWTAPAYVHSPGGRLASNPVVAVDGQSRFSVVWLGFRADADAPDEHVYVSRLDDATSTFGAPVLASDDGSSTTRDFDKPSLTIDANDDLLLTWADFTGNASMDTPPSLTFARSTDGATFTRSTITADMTFGNLAYLCLDASLGPAAPLYVVHLGANGTVALRVSPDQGTTWQLMSTPAASVVFQDVTCAVHGTDLWIGYASGSATFSAMDDAPADTVFVMHSADGGGTFDAPVAVSNGAAGVQYLFPQLARSSSGNLEVVYYQGTVGAAATLELASSDVGAVWTGATIGTPGNFTIDRTIPSWLGDYLGLATTSASTFTTYTDNSAGKAHIAFGKVQTP